MKAVEISPFGAPDVLRLTERPDPVAGAGEALIRVAASGVNRPDVLQRKGHYPVPAGASDLPGLEVAGLIVGGDDDAMAAAGFNLGDRVCALVAGGGYAELCVAPVGQCLPTPEGLSDIEAASLPETFFTVWSNVFDRGRLQPDETLLVQGGTSGIGVTAIQLAKAGRDRDRHGRQRREMRPPASASAPTTPSTTSQDFVAEVLRHHASAASTSCSTWSPGLTWRAKSNAWPKTAVWSSSPCKAARSRDRCWRAAAPPPHPHRLDAAAACGRFQVGHRDSAAQARLALARGGRVKPVIHQVFPAAQAAQAHVLMESNQHIGKLVLRGEREPESDACVANSW